jgi:hypothetical protein
MSDIRKKFWKQSKELIEGCNDKELGILRNMVNKAIEGKLTAGNEKYLSGKKHQLIVGRG